MDLDFITRFDLKPLALTDRAELKKFYDKIDQPLAEHSFASWYIWGSPLNIHWTIFKDHLCMFVGGGEDMTLFIPPLKGPLASDSDFPNVIRFVFEIMDSWNLANLGKCCSAIDYVPDDLKKLFEQLQDSLEIVPSGTDYIYDTKAMIDLPGSNLKSKRHAKTKFMRDFPDHIVHLYDDRFKSDCLALLENWARHRKSHDLERCNNSNVALAKLVSRDQDAVVLALNHWQELGLNGMVVYVGSQLAGFTFGEALTENQASILIEKTDSEFPGCPQFLFSEFCRGVWQGFAECNAGDDWGIPNLCFTKMSYRPKKLIPKFMVRYKQVS